MLIEIGAPASLPVGLVRLDNKGIATIALLAVTLQHPPIHLFAQAAANLTITGARADVAYRYAAQALAHWGREDGAEIEVELATPAAMGLGSEAMLALSVSRALAWVNGMPLDDAFALARAAGLGPAHAPTIHGFTQGGVVLARVAGNQPSLGETQSGDSSLFRRYELSHDPEEAWVFVLVLPRPPRSSAATLEAERLTTLLRAAPYLSARSGQLVMEELWPALEQNDLAAFAQALMDLQRLNQRALAGAGTPLPLTSEEQTILAAMQQHGALAWGLSATGLALFALIKGASASIALRKSLSAQVGIYGGTVMAAITDNHGSRHALHNLTLAESGFLRQG